MGPELGEVCLGSSPGLITILVSFAFRIVLGHRGARSGPETQRICLCWHGCNEIRPLLQQIGQWLFEAEFALKGRVSAHPMLPVARNHSCGSVDGESVVVVPRDEGAGRDALAPLEGRVEAH